MGHLVITYPDMMNLNREFQASQMPRKAPAPARDGIGALPIASPVHRHCTTAMVEETVGLRRVARSNPQHGACSQAHLTPPPPVAAGEDLRECLAESQPFTCAHHLVHTTNLCKSCTSMPHLLHKCSIPAQIFISKSHIRCNADPTHGTLAPWHKFHISSTRLDTHCALGTSQGAVLIVPQALLVWSSGCSHRHGRAFSCVFHTLWPSTCHFVTATHPPFVPVLTSMRVAACIRLPSTIAPLHRIWRMKAQKGILGPYGGGGDFVRGQFCGADSPPPPQVASGQQLVVKGTGQRSP